MLTVLICTPLAFALLRPGSQVARALRDLLIDLPARQLAKLTPTRIMVGVLLIAAMAGLIAFAKSDGLILVAQIVPDAIGLFAAFDLATYVDVIGLLLLIAASARLRAGLRALSAVATRSWRRSLRHAKRLHFIQHRAMERRRRPRKTARPPSDGDVRSWCAAAYAFA